MEPPGPDAGHDPSAQGSSSFASQVEWRLVGCLLAPLAVGAIVLVAWILTSLGVPLTEENFWPGVFIAIFGLPVLVAIGVAVRSRIRNRRGPASSMRPLLVLIAIALVPLASFVGGFVLQSKHLGYRTTYFLATPNAQTVDFLTLEQPNSALGSRYGFNGTFDESWIDPTFKGVNTAHATFSGYREGSDFTIEFNDEVVHSGQAGVILDSSVVAIFGAGGGQFEGAQITIAVPQEDGSTKNEAFAPSVASASPSAVAKLGAPQ